MWFNCIHSWRRCPIFSLELLSGSPPLLGGRPNVLPLSTWTLLLVDSTAVLTVFTLPLLDESLPVADVVVDVFRLGERTPLIIADPLQRSSGFDPGLIVNVFGVVGFLFRDAPLLLLALARDGDVSDVSDCDVMSLDIEVSNPFPLSCEKKN